MTQELMKLDYEDKGTLQLMKDTICKGTTDEEFKLFAYTCKRLGLDPFARQVFVVKRWDASLKREAMTIQTSIDGYRLIADRTGRYSPGKPPEFTYEDGKLLSATAFVQKQTNDGVWHEVGASAYYSEYAAFKKDGSANHMWASKPHIMLSKCAEALALRKAFPAELSGAYTKEEMEQADNPTEIVMPSPTPIIDYHAFIEKWSEKYDKNLLLDYIEKHAKHFKQTPYQTVSKFIQNESGFDKECEAWVLKQANTLPASNSKE